MTDQEVRQAVSEQVVQSAETIESLRIEVVRLEAERDKWYERAMNPSGVAVGMEAAARIAECIQPITADKYEVAAAIRAKIKLVKR